DIFRRQRHPRGVGICPRGRPDGRGGGRVAGGGGGRCARGRRGAGRRRGPGGGVVPAAESVDVAATGAALLAITSDANVTICCRTPSSSSSKSSIFRPETTAPFLSRTTTSTRTRLTLLRKTGVGGDGACCPIGA